MPLLQIAEVFGNDTSTPTEENQRKNKHCPFLGRACTKQGKVDPLGICSYTDGVLATVVCPARFREENRLFVDAGRQAFGRGHNVLAVPEVSLLQLPGSIKRIGKVDYVLGLMNESGDLVDFAALEVQAVYMSGLSSRASFEHYLRTGGIQNSAKRRPDFRSSAQKRLMPQLALKVPIFRRWNKKFFVAVDSTFFAAMPKLPTVQADNAEISWLVYNFDRELSGFQMQGPEVYHTVWEDVLYALREGIAPTREELLSTLKRSKRSTLVAT